MFTIVNGLHLTQIGITNCSEVVVTVFSELRAVLLFVSELALFCRTLGRISSVSSRVIFTETSIYRIWRMMNDLYRYDVGVAC